MTLPLQITVTRIGVSGLICGKVSPNKRAGICEKRLRCLFILVVRRLSLLQIHFMNRREAIMACAATVAGAVAIPPAASAQAAVTDDNPDLEPIRALLDVYDTAFTNHDLAEVMATMSEKATIMGCGPGEIWSGPDEIKAAHEHLFESFDIGEQNFEYEFSIGELASDTGWMMTSGNVNGKKDGKDFTFPVNISLSVKKDGGKWLIAAMHFSTVTDGNREEE